MPEAQPGQEQRMETRPHEFTGQVVNGERVCKWCAGTPSECSLALGPNCDKAPALTRPTADLGEDGELVARLLFIDDAGEFEGTLVNPDGPEAADRIEQLREALELADYRLHLIIEDAMEGGRSKEVAVFREWQSDIRAVLSRSRG